MAINHVGIDGAQRFVVETQFARCGHALIVMDHVCPAHQALHHRLRGRILQRQRNRALAALAADEGGIQPAHRIARRHFNLDDRRAEIGE